MLAYSMRGVIMKSIYTVGEMVVTKIVDTTIVKTSKYVMNKLVGGGQTQPATVDEGTETDNIPPIPTN
jgi:hypothetical protein